MRFFADFLLTETSFLIPEINKNIVICRSNHFIRCFNPIQDGGGGANRPSSVTSANVEISPRNLLTFSFNPFATLVKNVKSVPGASP